MFKVSKILILFALINLAFVYAEVENDDESVCKMETKKGLVQLKEKYKDRIQQWKELQKRGCLAKTDVKEANEGLEECINKKFEAMSNTKLKVTFDLFIEFNHLDSYYSTN